MNWQDRINLELRLLNSKAWRFANWRWEFVPQEGMFIAGGLPTNSGQLYTVMIVVRLNFPSQQPELYVAAPRPNVPSYSHEAHTLELHPKLGQRICGYQDWRPDNTLAQGALRLREWLEAYEISQRKRVTIDQVLQGRR